MRHIVCGITYGFLVVYCIASLLLICDRNDDMINLGSANHVEHLRHGWGLLLASAWYCQYKNNRSTLSGGKQYVDVCSNKRERGKLWIMIAGNINQALLIGTVTEMSGVQELSYLIISLVSTSCTG